MTSQNKSIARQNELMRATLACIATQGIENTTVRRIAEIAGVTNGLIRFYFDNKEGIIRKSFEYFQNNLRCLALSQRPMASASADEQLDAFVRGFLSPPVAVEENVVIWASFLPWSQKDAFLGKVRMEFRDETLACLSRLIRECCAARGWTPPAAEAAEKAVAINALIDGLWIDASTPGSQPPPERVRDLAVRSALSIIEADAPQPLVELA